MTTISKALWRLYHRPQHPLPFAFGGNLPYDDSSFSKRMLQLHLSDDDAAASRSLSERMAQIKWIQHHLALSPNKHLLDVACGPGLYAVPFAKQGIHVTGIDFSPSAIEYGRKLAKTAAVETACTFLEQDMHQVDLLPNQFDAIILLYGQLGVMSIKEAKTLLRKLYLAIKPGGKLLIELLDSVMVDKQNSTWWFTDDTGLWGDTPYLHLGERLWYPDKNISMERYHIISLETGEMDEIILCDQVYNNVEISRQLHAAGFSNSSAHPQWDNIGLYDEVEWCVHIATK